MVGSVHHAHTFGCVIHSPSGVSDVLYVQGTREVIVIGAFLNPIEGVYEVAAGLCASVSLDAFVGHQSAFLERSNANVVLIYVEFQGVLAKSLRGAKVILLQGLVFGKDVGNALLALQLGFIDTKLVLILQTILLIGQSSDLGDLGRALIV